MVDYKRTKGNQAELLKATFIDLNTKSAKITQTARTITSRIGKGASTRKGATDSGIIEVKKDE